MRARAHMHTNTHSHMTQNTRTHTQTHCAGARGRFSRRYYPTLWPLTTAIHGYFSRSLFNLTRLIYRIAGYFWLVHQKGAGHTHTHTHTHARAHTHTNAHIHIPETCFCLQRQQATQTCALSAVVLRPPPPSRAPRCFCPRCPCLH